MPYGNKQPYDFLVDLKNKFLRIQVKTASTHHEKVSCKFKRISTVSLGKKQKDYIGKIDYFAIYYPEKELICLIPEQVTRNKADRVIVRYENPKRTPDYSPNMILAQDYTMEKFLSKHGVKV